jgi:hypothetical protein
VYLRCFRGTLNSAAQKSRLNGLSSPAVGERFLVTIVRQRTIIIILNQSWHATTRTEQHMKKAIVTICCLIAMVFTASAGSSFTGKIISVLSEGALVSVDDEQNGAALPPLPGSVVYVRSADLARAVHDSRFRITGVLLPGRYQYTTAVGGLATARGYQAQHVVCVDGSPEGY